MFNIGELVATIKADISNFQSGMQTVTQTASTATKSIGDKFTSAGSTITGAGKSLTLLGAPIVALGTVGVKQAIDVESAWKNVAKVYDGAADDINNKLTPAVSDLTIKFGKNKLEVINTMAELAAMGYSGPELIDMVTQSMEFATVAGLDLDTATQGVIATSAIYGVTGKELTDVLAKMNTVENGTAATAGDLATAVTTAGNVANATGVSFDELAGMMAVLRTRGVEAGESSNSLKTILMRVQDTSKSSASTYEQLGIQVKDANGNLMDSDEILVQLAGKWDTLTEAEQAEFVKKQIGIMQGDKFLALMDDMGKKNSLYKKTVDSTADSQENLNGYTNEMNIFLDSSATKLAQAKAKFMEMAETVGLKVLPVLIKLLEFVGGLMDKFNNLPKPVQDFIIVGALLFAAIGPLLLIIGQMATGIGAIIKVVGLIGSAGSLMGAFSGLITMIGGALSAAFAFIISPIGLIVLAIMAVIAIGVLLWKNWDKVSEFAVNIWNKIKNFFSDFFTWYIDSWKAMFEWYINLWKTIFEKAKEILSTVFNAIKDFVVGYINWYINAWKTVLDWYINLWKSIFDKASQIISTVFNAIKNIINGVFQWIKTAVTNVGNSITSGFTNALNTTKSWIETSFNNILNIFRSIPSKVTSALSGLWSAIRAPFESAYNTARDFVNKIKSELDRINPFHRESPSLVDNVKSGVEMITGYYKDLAELDMFKVTGMGMNVNPAFSQVDSPTSVYVDLKGANISSPQVAQQYAETIGDAIINRLGVTKRSYR